LGNLEEVKRIDSEKLFSYDNLSQKQKINSKLNLEESTAGKTLLESKPRRIVLELTNSCNLNCIMCGRNNADFKPTFFNVNWLEKIRPFMETAEEITLMGWGEPTIHPQFDKFLEFASDYPVKKYILTNGVNLNNVSHWLLEYGTDILAFSLDGPDSRTNDSIRIGSDFNEITSNIRQFVIRRTFAPVKPYINTVSTLMKRNIRKFPEMIILAAELGIEEVKGVYLTAFSKELEEEVLFNEPELVRSVFEEARNLADKYNITLSVPHIPGEDPAGNFPHKYCHLAWRDLFIGSDGYLRSCMSSENKFNHILESEPDPVKNIWNGEPLISFRKSVNGPAEGMTSACRRCYQSSCANWNKAYSFIQTDMEFHPDWS